MIRRTQTLALLSLFSVSQCAHALSEQPTSNRATYAQNIATKPGAHLVLIAGLTFGGVERWCFGAGARFVNSPETNITINGASQKSTYDKTTGAVVEFGYKMAPSS